MEDSTVLIAPIFLVEGTTRCYNKECYEVIDVVTIAASGYQPDQTELDQLSEVDKTDYVEGCPNPPVLLMYVDFLPQWALQLIQSKYPQYQRVISHAYGDSYFLNHCPHCGYRQGDFFLNKPSDGPFFPCTKEEAKKLTVSEIQSEGIFECCACVHQREMDFIPATNEPQAV